MIIQSRRASEVPEQGHYLPENYDEIHLELLLNTEIALAIDNVLIEHAERRALLDPLLFEYGVFNREGLRLELDREVAVMQRETDPKACILYLDLDRFKSVNERFGHDGGDEALMETTRRIRAVMRQTDIIGRVGGDELLLAAINTDMKGATLLSERILEQFDTPMIIKGQPYRLGVSIGVSPLEHDPLDPDAIHDSIARADTAQYQAKRLGRNRVEIQNDGG